MDYQQVTASDRDKLDKNSFKGEQTVVIAATGSVLNPRTGEKAMPRFLGGEAPKTSKGHDELLALADWLAHSPMFARTQVNRVWFNLLGRGLVDPVDDFRASNPPSHPALLDALVSDFTAHGYDLRHLIRTIMASRTYQRASEPNATNAADEANFSHNLVRRLTAEQVTDSASAVLKAPIHVPGLNTGMRLAQLPEGQRWYLRNLSEAERFAAGFGKPPRLIASDCERSNEVALPQVFQLLSGPFLQEMLTRSKNRLTELLTPEKPLPEVAEQLFWLTLSRPPTATEAEKTTAYLSSGPSLRSAAEDVTWALLNSKEFLFRR